MPNRTFSVIVLLMVQRLEIQASFIYTCYNTGQFCTTIQMEMLVNRQNSSNLGSDFHEVFGNIGYHNPITDCSCNNSTNGIVVLIKRRECLSVRCGETLFAIDAENSDIDNLAYRKPLLDITDVGATHFVDENFTGKPFANIAESTFFNDFGDIHRSSFCVEKRIIGFKHILLA